MSRLTIERAASANQPEGPLMHAMSQDAVLPEGEPLRLNDWAGPAAWVLAIFAGLAGLFLLFISPARHGNLDGSLRPVLGLAWLVFGLLVAGGARSGLIVDEHGIAVQGWVRRRRCRWSEVAGFELKRPFLRQALRIKLADGSEVSTLGFGAKSVDERSLAEARVAELNRRASACAK